jgi:hypothetical protein
MVAVGELGSSLRPEDYMNDEALSDRLIERFIRAGLIEQRAPRGAERDRHLALTPLGAIFVYAAMEMVGEVEPNVKATIMAKLRAILGGSMAEGVEAR